MAATELAAQLESIGQGQEEALEYRLFGPPGTGKTTYTSRQIHRAVKKYGNDAVLVTSFSRAAAAELVGRDLPVDERQIATMHAHCYRALGKPEIADSNTESWNEQAPKEWHLVPRKKKAVEDLHEDDGKGGAGRPLLDRINRWRNRCANLESALHPWEYHFYQRWTAWKRENNYVDFTDMLEMALRDIKVAPGAPRVIFVDEAQDFSRLQLKIVRQWGKHTDYFLVVGDDDQTIFQFTGATPEAFLTPDIDPKYKITLSQSFRVPAAVHRLADKWIAGVTKREPKIYQPTAEPGNIRYEELSLRKPDLFVRAIETELARNKKIMILTACSYMLYPIQKHLRERGIPFHNPYRAFRGDWNPLSNSKGITASQRLQALLMPHNSNPSHRPWTVQTFKVFSSWMRATGTFNLGVKAGLDTLPDETEVTMNHLKEWMPPDAFLELVKLSMHGSATAMAQWWLDRLLPKHVDAAMFPGQILARRGLHALSEEPKVVIGTIHSVKGGEADVVYLFPDLSSAGNGEWNSKPGESRDAIIRQFYVGITRARDRLIICQPSGSYTVTIQ